MTLLVIEIKVPGHQLVASHGLAASLAALWPSEKNDHPFLYWNGLLLLCVTFVPFPTALLAEYLLHADGKVPANRPARGRQAARRIQTSLKRMG